MLTFLKKMYTFLHKVKLKGKKKVKRKVKERKVKESKVNKIPAVPEDSKKQKHKYGKYKNVLLTEEEIKQLREKLPKDWENWIETFSEGLGLRDISITTII